MDVQEKLVTLINDFAMYKSHQNNPNTRRSRYWSMDTFNYTPWYHELFPRDRFEMIYSTMLHAGSIGDKQSKKDKSEPFLNMLKFQNAFYREKDLSLDEMVVK